MTARLIAVVSLLLLSIGCSGAQQLARDFAATFSEDAHVPSPPQQALLTAARRGDVPGLTAAVSQGADINGADPLYGRTALMRAAAFNHVAAVRALLQAGAAVGGTDLDGDSILHVAASAGAADVIPVLVAAGADVNAQRQPEGWTPLWRAVDAAQPAAVVALLAAGADVERRGPREPSPLERAILLADPEIVEALLTARPSLRPAGTQAASLVHLVIDNVQPGDAAVIRLLLAAGADGTATDDRGQTPLQRAVSLARAGFPEHSAALVSTLQAAGTR
jgi:ankyrin repeat protein